MGIKSHSWDLITEHYASLVSHGWKIEPMCELVEYIKKNYLDRVFGFTSLDQLIVSIYPDINKTSEALHVKFDQEQQKFKFSYWGGITSAPQPEWVRECSSDNGIEQFEKFRKVIKW
jgi:tetrahydromethanopterin S-methyltransferase subunit E